MAPVK